MSKKKISYTPTNNKIHNSILMQDISEHRSIEDKEMHHQHVLPVEVENELDLNLQKYSTDIKQQIRYILMDLLKYPSTSQAERHRQSNRLGSLDLKHVIDRQNGNSSYFHNNRRPQVCNDCGLAVQQANIPVCSSMWQFPKAGPAIFHLFQDVKRLAWQIFILGIFYSILALYVSIVEPTESFAFSNFPRKVSYIPLMIYSSSNSILSAVLAGQACLIVISVLIWWVMHFIMRCCQTKYERLVEEEYLSPSHFTIMLENVPAYYNKEQLQQELKRYFQSLAIRQRHLKQWGFQLKPCEIQRICRVVPFNLSQNEIMDQQLKGLDKDISQKRRLLSKWMLQFKQNSRFTFQKAQRGRQYQVIERMLERRRDKVKQMQDKARQQYKLPINRELKTTYFVTFKYNQTASIIQQHNPQSIAAYVRYFLTCCRTANYISLKDHINNQEVGVTARRAPDPEDVIWGNLNAPLRFRILGKLASWGIILSCWGVTFGVCYGLNSLSIKNGLSYMPVVLAAVLTVFNVFLKFAVREISIYQNDETYSGREEGILLKCLIGCAVNWILTPVILSLLVNRNSYDSNGLVYLIFWLSITNAVIPPLLRIFDLWYLIKRILAYRQMQPYKKMELRQSQLHAYIEYEQYNIGWSYVYFIDLFLFTCFYATMIPAIILFTLIGFFLMYWAEKYALLNRSKRPLVNCQSLTESAKSLILLGPLILGVGGLIWVYLPLSSSSSQWNSIIMIAYLTLMGLGALYFITPFESIYKCLCVVPQEQILLYSQCRQKFKSEYERMNPASFEQGSNDYYSLIHKRKQQDRLTALNISQGNLVQDLDTNQIIEGVTKIPNIFGKDAEIANKINQEYYLDNSPNKNKEVNSPSKIKEEVIFMSKEKADNIQLLVQQEQREQKLSRAQTQKKVSVINYNSSGNGYSRRKKHNERRTISVLQQGYDI